VEVISFYREENASVAFLILNLAFDKALTIWSARAAALLYVCGLGLILWRRWRPARLSWTLGLSAYLFHVWCAFQYFYQWSHALAYRETARQTAELFGIAWGGGLYLNYLFTGVWFADVVLSWLRPAWWQARSAWFIAVNLYLGFMFVNATLVVWLLREARH